MNLITYNGLVAAIPGATRVFFAPHLEQRPDGDPERRFVSMMILYYHAIQRSEIPGPYSDADAELYARVALIDDEEFEAAIDASDDELAERFEVPLEQIVAKRSDERVSSVGPMVRAAERHLLLALEAVVDGVADDTAVPDARRAAAGELLNVAHDVRRLADRSRLADESVVGSDLATRARQLVGRADEVRHTLEQGPASSDVATPRVVSAEICAGAQRLSALFKQDTDLAAALNVAQDRLLEANEQLTSGLSPEALRAIYGPPGPDLALSGRKPPVLEHDQPIAALEQVAHEIRSALLEYQHVADERRALGMDVGEANAALQRAMAAAGFTLDEGRHADVHALAQGVLRMGPTGD